MQNEYTDDPVREVIDASEVLDTTIVIDVADIPSADLSHLASMVKYVGTTVQRDGRINLTEAMILVHLHRQLENIVLGRTVKDLSE